MALPKQDLPKYKHFLKGIGKEVTYRGFTNREQKILLLAKESEDTNEMIGAMKQIVEKCVYDIDVESLPIFDFEDIFLRIRSKSVSENTSLYYRHKETNEKIVIDVDLRDVEVKGDVPNKIIHFSDNYGVEMKFPTISSYSLSDDEFLLSCIKSVFTEDEVTDFQSHSQEEKNEWIDDLDPKMIMKMNEFLSNIPVLRHDIEYELEDKKKITISLKGLYDFFY